MKRKRPELLPEELKGAAADSGPLGGGLTVSGRTDWITLGPNVPKWIIYFVKSERKEGPLTPGPRFMP